ncbi:hypothetical protein PHAVU_010G044500 [Phaseolus vulgaris]|uniref:Nucleotide-diphospho-sugar transferase domain-containing protein n=1 Tax=Phaseolus vulgaris TaxID=3885 RepID=V7AMA0_PHAVU|nr:hypothetical protein PHAVU_010G044500g [Phaseolus vulgaris]ESW06390.1 hypothetical protein PHAVU_010G044500g [Phaseolus vulgaris]
MWLRNPFTKLSKDETEDLQISTDVYHGDPWSNNKTISLFETWYSQKDNGKREKEQDVLFDLIRRGVIQHLGLRVRFLDTVYFSGFCQDSKDFKAVTTIHANCCRSITAKMAYSKAVLSDWKRFIKLDNSSMENSQWTKHDWCWKSWETPKQTNG